MSAEPTPGVRFGYCSNVHPGESWAEVQRNLERYVVAVKERVSPQRPFGVGLRLSARAAGELAEPAALEQLQAFLDASHLYVFTINAFPYGAFHGEAIKEKVYLPDWRMNARLVYSNLCADLLARLLPSGVDEGSVSTVPGAFRPLARSAGSVEEIAAMLRTHAAHLVRLFDETGRAIACALEPEPACLIETSAEAARFLNGHLFAGASLRRFADQAGLKGGAAEQALRRHLGVCVDTCHCAVQFEEPEETINVLQSAGVRIAKVQLSAGLRVRSMSEVTARALDGFGDEVYLHQVVERSPDGLARYVDLPEALQAFRTRRVRGPQEWRIHFHVPIFLERLGVFESTQGYVRRFLELQAARRDCAELEVETYTWQVLPAAYRGRSVVEDVSREMRWVSERLAP